MIATLTTNELLQRLRAVERIIPAKAPSMPILAHVLVHADEDHVSLSTTDLSLSLTMRCTARVDAPGLTTLPVKSLVDMVGQISSPEVRMTVEQGRVRILSGQFQSRLQCLSAADFPTLPAYDQSSGRHLLPGPALRDAIRQVRPCINDEDKRFNIQGALLACNEPLALLVTTDGKRLAVATVPYRGASTQMIIPIKALESLMADDAPEYVFSIGPRQMFFAFENGVLSAHMLEATFPAYTRIVPRENDKVFTVQREALLTALRRVTLAGPVVKLTLGPNSLTLYAKSADVGEAAELVEGQYDADPLTVTIAGSSVIDFLNLATSPTVTMKLKNATTAALFEDGAKYLTVIMLSRDA